MLKNPPGLQAVAFLLLALFVIPAAALAAGEEPLTLAGLPRALGIPIFLDALEASQLLAHDLGVRLDWGAP